MVKEKRKDLKADTLAKASWQEDEDILSTVHGSNVQWLAAACP